MLESYKKSYEQYADIYIEDWRTWNKNILINKYLEVEDNPALANAYISAIIVRYWSKFEGYYYSSKKSTEAETCLEWLIRAILWGLKARKWKDPTSKLFTDPNGPDKVMNRCIRSAKQGWFQDSNAAKRKLNFGIESIEKLQDSLGELAPLPLYEEEELSASYLDINNLISKSFDNQDYITAFVINGIVNYDVFTHTRDERGKKWIQFSKRKLLKYFRHMDEQFCSTFSLHFFKSSEDVRSAVQSCKALTKSKLKIAINRCMKKLQEYYSEEVDNAI